MRRRSCGPTNSDSPGRVSSPACSTTTSRPAAVVVVEAAIRRSSTSRTLGSARSSVVAVVSAPQTLSPRPTASVTASRSRRGRHLTRRDHEQHETPAAGSAARSQYGRMCSGSIREMVSGRSARLNSPHARRAAASSSRPPPPGQKRPADRRAMPPRELATASRLPGSPRSSAAAGSDRARLRGDPRRPTDALGPDDAR